MLTTLADRTRERSYSSTQKMVRVCIFPKCSNKMTSWTKHSFHRLPLGNTELLKLWLIVLQMDPNTDTEELKLAGHRVCSAHFSPEDFIIPKGVKEGRLQKRQHINNMLSQRLLNAALYQWR